MSKQPTDELAFVMACLKHSETKPDFNAVGQELGISKNAAYHRHWQLCKKWGMTSSKAADAGSALAAASGAAGPATPKTPTKRGRPKKAAVAKDEADDDEDDDTPTKKLKLVLSSKKDAGDQKGKKPASGVDEDSE